MRFDQPGKTNTLQTLEAAAARGRDRGIDEIVLATTTGETARQALDLCKGFKLVKSSVSREIFDI